MTRKSAQYVSHTHILNPESSSPGLHFPLFIELIRGYCSISHIISISCLGDPRFTANGIFAGLGAAIALAHPLTILTAVVASPITSLNPMIAAGWVAGLVEVLLSKPKVKDFERLPEDIVSVKGFWKNKITRVLLIVVLTNMGSSLGAFVALPLMAKAF